MKTNLMNYGDIIIEKRLIEKKDVKTILDKKYIKLIRKS